MTLNMRDIDNALWDYLDVVFKGAIVPSSLSLNYFIYYKQRMEFYGDEVCFPIWFEVCEIETLELFERIPDVKRAEVELRDDKLYINLIYN